MADPGIRVGAEYAWPALELRFSTNAVLLCRARDVLGDGSSQGFLGNSIAVSYGKILYEQRHSQPDLSSNQFILSLNRCI